jgi:EAL domain-containing protein (putative c-di-GMP-specific phosphodiesterase class I)
MFNELDLIDPAGASIVMQAMAEGRIELAVQGVHDAHDLERLLYRECVARLRGTDGLVYGANEFVPILDVVGLTPKLDRHILTMVLDELEADPQAVLGCNLSMDNLASLEAWETIRNQIDRRGHLASRLILELTEGQPVVCPITAMEFVEQARGLGCRVAIDDFGRGYADPTRLFAFSQDIVKVDAQFVHDVRAGPYGRNSLYYMVGLASCTAPTVIVEGIETADHLRLAREAGATHLQGYLLSRPL